jgi:hypothetical protein
MAIDFDILVTETQSELFKALEQNEEVFGELSKEINLVNYKNKLCFVLHSYGVFYYHKLYSGELNFVKVSIVDTSSSFVYGYYLQYFKGNSTYESVLHFD